MTTCCSVATCSVLLTIYAQLSNPLSGRLRHSRPPYLASVIHVHILACRSEGACELLASFGHLACTLHQLGTFPARLHEQLLKGIIQTVPSQVKADAASDHSCFVSNISNHNFVTGFGPAVMHNSSTDTLLQILSWMLPCGHAYALSGTGIDNNGKLC